MTEVSLTPPQGQTPESGGLPARLPLTLAEEHVLLLWQVTAGAEKLLTATEHGQWPGGELTALAGYAQAEVLRQVSDEEALLFPAVPAQAVSGEQPMSLVQLATAVRDFVARLECHLRDEDELLASARAPQDVLGTVHFGGHPREWYLGTEGPVVDLDALPQARQSPHRELTLCRRP
jgi:hypothetical protein